MRISSINFVTAKPKKTFAKNNAIKSTTPSFNQTQNIIFKANLNIQDASLTQEIKDAKKDAQEIYLRTQEVKQNAHKIKDEVLENIAQLQKLAQGKSRYSIKANNVRYTYSIKDMHDDEYVKFWKECSYKEVTDGVVTREVSYNLNDWRVMQFVSSSYLLVDKDGKKLDDWTKTDTMYGTEVKIAEGYKFFADTLDKNEEYYYMFRVQDTQGNLYESNLVKAK